MNCSRLSPLRPSIFLLISLLAVALACSEPESAGECTETSQCDSGLHCIDSTCQNLDEYLSNQDAGHEDDVGDVDCRVNPCPQGLLCDESSGVCEQCSVDEECQEFAVCHSQTNRCTCQMNYQYCDGECISLDSVESCGSECVPCPSVEHGDPVCIDRNCSAECDDDYFLCDGDCDGPQGECVECLGDDHCTDPEAPVCAQGSCEPCESSSDCAGFADRPVCEPDTGNCVECMENEIDACGGTSCHPETYECTDTDVNSLTICQACLSDSECAPDHHCVPMEFDGTPRESAYCLKIDDDECEPPFDILTIKESVSGADMEIYCGINEELATCEAVLDYDTGCGSASECGDPDLDDAYCEAIELEISPRCTYGCELPEDPDESDGCYPFMGCEGGMGYCGGF